MSYTIVGENMDIDNFKSFIKTIPAIKDDVVKGKYTWQQLYEIYTLYGEDDQVFLPYKNRNNNDLRSFIEILRNIDLNAVSQGFDGILKILDIISQFSVKESQDKNKQWFDD